jgi:hypothetical protein
MWFRTRCTCSYTYLLALPNSFSMTSTNSQRTSMCATCMSIRLRRSCSFSFIIAVPNWVDRWHYVNQNWYLRWRFWEWLDCFPIHLFSFAEESLSMYVIFKVIPAVPWSQSAIPGTYYPFLIWRVRISTWQFPILCHDESCPSYQIIRGVLRHLIGYYRIVPWP